MSFYLVEEGEHTLSATMVLNQISIFVKHDMNTTCDKCALPCVILGTIDICIYIVR
jgi:hypothetical protein